MVIVPIPISILNCKFLDIINKLAMGCLPTQAIDSRLRTNEDLTFRLSRSGYKELDLRVLM